MTKAERIRQLYRSGRTTREIADLVGCKPEYVRVVARQRASGHASVHDKRWKEANRDKVRKTQANYMRKRYNSDPKFREKHLAFVRRTRLRAKARLLEAAE